MLQIPQCFYCKHYTDKRTCKAFPKGIPSELLEFADISISERMKGMPRTHKFEHNKIHPKQTGKYLFEDKNA